VHTCPHDANRDEVDPRVGRIDAQPVNKSYLQREYVQVFPCNAMLTSEGKVPETSGYTHDNKKPSQQTLTNTHTTNTQQTHDTHTQVRGSG